MSSGRESLRITEWRASWRILNQTMSTSIYSEVLIKPHFNLNFIFILSYMLVPHKFMPYSSLCLNVIYFYLSWTILIMQKMNHVVGGYLGASFLLFYLRFIQHFISIVVLFLFLLRNFNCTRQLITTAAVKKWNTFFMMKIIFLMSMMLINLLFLIVMIHLYEFNQSFKFRNLIKCES